MIVRINKWVWVILVCLPASPVLAGDQWNSSLTFSLGNGKAINACASPKLLLGTSGDECQESTQVFRLAYNYKFSRFWGFEFSAGDIGGAKGSGIRSASSLSFLIGDKYDWKLKAQGLALSGVGSIWLGKSFSLFGKVGVVHAYLEDDMRTHDATGDYIIPTINGVPTSQEKNALTYGFGFQYEFNNDLALRAQYEDFGKYDLYTTYNYYSANNLPEPDPIALSVISAGLVLKF